MSQAWLGEQSSDLQIRGYHLLVILTSKRPIRYPEDSRVLFERMGRMLRIVNYKDGGC